MKKKTITPARNPKLLVLADDAHDAYKLARKNWKNTRRAFRRSGKNARKAGKAYEHAAHKAGLGRKKVPARKPRICARDD